MFRKKKFIIGGLIIILAIAYLSYTGFESSSTYYYTVSELVAKKGSLNGESMRVNGQVAADSVEKDIGEHTLKFTITDAEGKDSLLVIYQGIVPDTFKGGGEVVVEGSLNSSGIFQASNILTKCPSKYVPEE